MTYLERIEYIKKSFMTCEYANRAMKMLYITNDNELIDFIENNVIIYKKNINCKLLKDEKSFIRIKEKGKRQLVMINCNIVNHSTFKSMKQLECSYVPFYDSTIFENVYKSIFITTLVMEYMYIKYNDYKKGLREAFNLMYNNETLLYYIDISLFQKECPKIKNVFMLLNKNTLDLCRITLCAMYIHELSKIYKILNEG